MEVYEMIMYYPISYTYTERFACLFCEITPTDSETHWHINALENKQFWSTMTQILRDIRVFSFEVVIYESHNPHIFSHNAFFRSFSHKSL